MTGLRLEWKPTRISQGHGRSIHIPEPVADRRYDKGSNGPQGEDKVGPKVLRPLAH